MTPKLFSPKYLPPTPTQLLHHTTTTPDSHQPPHPTDPQSPHTNPTQSPTPHSSSPFSPHHNHPAHSTHTHLETTTIYLWLSTTPEIFPYALTFDPKPTRINRAFTPMAHFTKLTNGKYIHYLTLPIHEATATIYDHTNQLTQLGYPMFSPQSGQPHQPTPPQPHQPTTQSNQTHPLQPIPPLPPEIEAPRPALYKQLHSQLLERIAKTEQNSRNCAKYRNKPDQYKFPN